MSDTRKNLQVRQPGIEGYDVSDKNGWPTPLTDPSSPLKFSVTNGSNGTQKNFDPTTTSQQRRGEHARPGGDPVHNVDDYTNQGGHKNELKTSQQNAGEHKKLDSSY